MTSPSHTPLRTRAQAARSASRRLTTSPLDQRNQTLRHAAALLEQRLPELLEANAADVAQTEGPSSLIQRLKLDADKVQAMIQGLHAVADLPDPVGQIRQRRRLDEGLELTQVTCPLGVLAVIFEARPDALVQIGALAIKSGNAALLKGGREAAETSHVLAAILQEALTRSDLPPDALQLLTSREEVEALLALDDLVDLVIPRGSSALVRHIQAHTRIPVLGHAEGICHIYVDAAADPAMALPVIRDAKTQYPAACNALETLLVHQDIPDLLAAIAEDLRSHGVELRGCPRTCARLSWVIPATEADWDTEYGDRILSIRVVDGLDQAIAHIHAHGSGHTEAILTRDTATAERFLAEVDASGVFHNASTRFADGYRYGLGAEVGISTGRIHARGPVGLEGLVSTKYLLRGSGQSVETYVGEGARSFLHAELPVGTP